MKMKKNNKSFPGELEENTSTESKKKEREKASLANLKKTLIRRVKNNIKTAKLL